jgi:integrase
MSLYKRPGSPNWWINITVGGVKTRKTTGTDDRQQAEEFEQRESERLWRLYKLGDKSSVLWGEVAKRWMQETTKRSKDMDGMILAWLSPYIDEEQVSHLDRDMIEWLRKTCLDDGVKKRSPATVDRYMCLVRSILNACVNEWRILDRAPKVPMYRPPGREPRWLTREEWQRLHKELPEHLQLAAHFAVITGLRMRAMLSLTWDRIDMEGKRLWIPKEHQKAGRTLGIPFSAEAHGVLKKLRRLNPTGTHVFQWNSRPIDDVNGKAFQDALKRAKIEGANWHSLRHTFASWAVQSGVTLQELMGLGDWKSFSMVLRYSHLAPDHLALAASKISTIGAQKAKRSKRPK